MVFEYYSNRTQDANSVSTWDPAKAQYMAAPSQAEGQYKFEISFRDGSTRNLKNISCTILNAVYTIHVVYQDSNQTVTGEVTNGEPLNATALGQESLFYDVVKAGPTATVFTNSESPKYNFTTAELDARYHGMQLRTIADTLVRALAGAIPGFGTVVFPVWTKFDSNIFRDR